MDGNSKKLYINLAFSSSVLQQAIKYIHFKLCYVSQQSYKCNIAVSTEFIIKIHRHAVHKLCYHHKLRLIFSKKTHFKGLKIFTVSVGCGPHRPPLLSVKTISIGTHDKSNPQINWPSYLFYSSLSSKNVYSSSERVCIAYMYS